MDEPIGKGATTLDYLKVRYKWLGELIDLAAARERELLARVAELEAELALWKPLSPEEAERALEEAEAVPLSEERIAEIVKAATDPAGRVTNGEQAQMAARIRALEDRLAEVEEAAELNTRPLLQKPPH